MSLDLPFHPLNGLQAVGFRRNGAPIWPILGAAEDDDDEEAERLLADFASEDDQGTDDEDDEQNPADDKAAQGALGDAGKKALDAMKAKWQKERDRRKAADAKLAAAEKAKTPEGETPSVDAIRAEVEKAATAKSNERIIRSEIRAAAAGKLHDPKDALAHLDLAKFEVDDEGNVDEDEIAEAIEDLLKRKPYLGAQREEKRFQGSADAGARGKAGKPQLTEADVKQLAAQGKHAEIEQARLDGRLNDLLGIK